jgi:hypothetical protein
MPSTSTGAQKSRSYGTVTPAKPHQIAPSTQRLNGMVFDTPSQHAHNQPDSGCLSDGEAFGEEDDLFGPSGFEDQVDDRTLWMRNGRQGKATIGSCVSK